MFGSAVAMQALISATNLVIGLVLIRRTAAEDYGLFVLVTAASLLLCTLQGAFIQPPMVIRMARSSAEESADIVGGLLQSLRRILLWGSAGITAAILFCASWGLLKPHTTSVLVAAVFAIASAMYREFFRTVLLGKRRSQDVLKGDVYYVATILVGVPMATLTPYPATVAILALGVGALVGAAALSRRLWRCDPWNPLASMKVMREMAPLGTWSALGSATHWAFSQGFNYLVAGILNVGAVAALASTRLLMMPINLISTGIGSLMMATASGWLVKHGVSALFRRLLAIACVMAATALCYFIAVWLARDLIFTWVLKKHFPQSDALVIAWSAVFFVTVFRDQLNFVPGACGLHRPLMGITAIAAIVALISGYLALRQYGVVGAPVGILLGEIINVCGILYLSWLEIKKGRTAPPPAKA